MKKRNAHLFLSCEIEISQVYFFFFLSQFFSHIYTNPPIFPNSKLNQESWERILRPAQ